MKDKILTYCERKNVLLDEILLDIFSQIKNFDDIKLLIDYIKSITGKRFISFELVNKNKFSLKKTLFSESLVGEDTLKIIYDKFKINNEKNIFFKKKIQQSDKKNPEGSVKIKSSFVKPGKSLEVKDFVNYFRKRYDSFSNILQENYELENLISISKISKEKQKISIIGMIISKKQTKNNNIILEVEDLTGKIKILISSQKEDLIKESEDISLDSVLGFSGFSSGDIIFANKIIFPEIRLSERKKSLEEEYVIFLGDLHYGSKKFLKKSFEGFLNYIKGNVPNTPEVEKIKYIFIVGDLVTGIGNYPNQEEDLEVSDLEDQFIGLANLLKQIPERIKIIISPGNHDCVRLMEPQPLLDEKYAWPLYDLKNVIFIENPSLVNIGQTKNFPGWDVLIYHGFSYPYYANTIPKLMIERAMNSPEKIMKYLLKNRHLAPTHGSTQYFPSEKDPFFIKKAPDIFLSGHTHKSGVAYENNVLVVSVSAWEGMTSYQEKFGNKPDHCKVPLLNMKTRSIKILDFEVDEGIKTYSEEKNKN